MSELEKIKQELRKEIIELYEIKLEQAKESFQSALKDKNLIIEINEDPYKGKHPKRVKKWKIRAQFLIGFLLISVLLLKGFIELSQTIYPNVDLYFPYTRHILDINIYKYIANALGISAGIELGYMLFTDGPDETLEPLMMAIAAGAFYCVSESPELHSAAILLYSFSLLVLILCVVIYRKFIEK